MYILVISVLLGFVFYKIIQILIHKRYTENFTQFNEPYINDDNSHYFLAKKLLPPNKAISVLSENNPHHTNYFYIDQNLTRPEQTDLNVSSYKRNKPNKPNTQLCQTINKYKPLMYDKGDIVDLYDHLFYRDRRFPERPIDTEFAVNPYKYIMKNPHIYPSYKCLAKN